MVTPQIPFQAGRSAIRCNPPVCPLDEGPEANEHVGKRNEGRAPALRPSSDHASIHIWSNVERITETLPRLLPPVRRSGIGGERSLHLANSFPRIILRNHPRMKSAKYGRSGARRSVRPIHRPHNTGRKRGDGKIPLRIQIGLARLRSECRGWSVVLKPDVTLSLHFYPLRRGGGWG